MSQDANFNEDTGRDLMASVMPLLRSGVYPYLATRYQSPIVLASETNVSNKRLNYDVSISTASNKTLHIEAKGDSHEPSSVVLELYGYVAGYTGMPTRCRPTDGLYGFVKEAVAAVPANSQKYKKGLLLDEALPHPHYLAYLFKNDKGYLFDSRILQRNFSIASKYDVLIKRTSKPAVWWTASLLIPLSDPLLREALLLEF